MGVREGVQGRVAGCGGGVNACGGGCEWGVGHLRLPRLLVLDFDCDVRVAQPVQVAALEVLGLLEQH
eukprot:scaffold5532_cov54-Isochrysis_galbana.AAC.1